MQIVSTGDNLQEMSKPIFWKKKKKDINKLLSAKYAHGVWKRLNSASKGFNILSFETQYMFIDEFS